MIVINAIAKVRFNSAKPQRVQLHRSPKYGCDLLCLEPQQQFDGSGNCGYYVIAGSGEIKAGKDADVLEMGRFAACGKDEDHTIINTSEQRLICLVISYRS